MYYDVIDDVIGAVRDAVLDEGIDEAVLGDLKTLWKKKLDESRALEGPHQDQQVKKSLNRFNLHAVGKSI